VGVKWKLQVSTVMRSVRIYKQDPKTTLPACGVRAERLQSDAARRAPTRETPVESEDCIEPATQSPASFRRADEGLGGS